MKSCNPFLCNDFSFIFLMIDSLSGFVYAFTLGGSNVLVLGQELEMDTPVVENGLIEAESNLQGTQ